MRYLYHAPWKGNVRELENAIERALVLCKADQIELSHFFLTDEAPELPSVAHTPLPASASQPPMPSLPVGSSVTLAELERQHILNTLRAQEGHRARTAELLDISIRTLRNKLNEYRVTGEEV
jgi:two-component system response regulator AtoC